MLVSNTSFLWMNLKLWLSKRSHHIIHMVEFQPHKVQSRQKLTYGVAEASVTFGGKGNYLERIHWGLLETW